MKLLISGVVVMVGAVSVGVSAQPGGTMDHSGGWMNGGAAAWLWIVVGILVAVLLVVLITKQFNNKP